MPVKNLTFADRLRSQRRRSDLTQAQLAKKLGVPQQNVANWERGSVPRAFPTDEYRNTMLLLADFMALSVPELLTLCYVPKELQNPQDPLADLGARLARITDEFEKLKATEAVEGSA